MSMRQKREGSFWLGRRVLRGSGRVPAFRILMSRECMRFTFIDNKCYTHNSPRSSRALLPCADRIAISANRTLRIYSCCSIGGMSRVLLIDDEPRFCQATSELLRRYGHEVSTANGLAPGKELLHSANPDVVLLDLILPDGNGLEFFEQIKGNRPNVVIITGHPSIKARIRHLAGPSVSYLTKPVDIHDSFASLKILRRKAPARPLAPATRGSTSACWLVNAKECTPSIGR